MLRFFIDHDILDLTMTGARTSPNKNLEKDQRFIQESYEFEKKRLEWAQLVFKKTDVAGL